MEGRKNGLPPDRNGRDSSTPVTPFQRKHHLTKQKNIQLQIFCNLYDRNLWRDPATARKDCSYQVHNDRTETGQRLFLYPSDRYYRSKIKKLHFGVGDFLSPTSNSRNKQKWMINTKIEIPWRHSCYTHLNQKDGKMLATSSHPVINNNYQSENLTWRMIIV